MCASIAFSDRNSVVDDPDDLVQIQFCDDAQWLIAEFHKEHATGLRSIKRMAAIVCRLNDKGIELPESSHVPHLLRIGAGMLNAELYYVVRDHHLLLERTKTLRPEIQQQVARNEPFKVMLLNGDHLMIAPLAMTSTQIRQTFKHGEVRSDSEQSAWLHDQMQRGETRKSPTRDGATVQIDRKRGGILLGGVFLPAADMARYLGELAKPLRS
jgi:hypothetical protein